MSTFDDLPDPPVPADLDLRDYPFVQIDIERLRRSRSWRIEARKNPELGFFMMNLWLASWHERPAASVEDDDEVLADLAMCALKKWMKVRAIVLRGWVKCRDGRLYHPVVAEKALEAWKKKKSLSCRGKSGALSRWRQDIENPNVEHATAMPEQCAGIAEALAADGKGEGEGEGEGEDSSLRSESCSLRSQRAREDAKNPENGDLGSGADPPTRPRAPPHRGLPPDWRERWGEWWWAWPHKVAKTAAERAYRRALACSSPAELLLGAARYIAAKPPDRQWCNPATWLNDKRWLDEPAPPAHTTGSPGTPSVPPVEAPSTQPIPHALGPPGDELRHRIGDAAFRAWCADLVVDSLAAGRLVLLAPSRLKRDWVRSYFEADIHAAWRTCDPAVREVRIVVEGAGGRAAARPSLMTRDALAGGEP